MKESLPKSLAPLMRQLRPDYRPCLFVSQAGERSQFKLTQFSGGRDATYILVERRPSSADSDRSPYKEVVGFSPQIEGVEIIYDATDETMQGKARPFMCDLSEKSSRFYAVLPFQIEKTVISLTGQGRTRLRIEFQDARGKRLEAALPFQAKILEFEVRGSRGLYDATCRDGRFSQELSLSAEHAEKPPTAAVRSLLTGQTESSRARG